MRWVSYPEVVLWFSVLDIGGFIVFNAIYFFRHSYLEYKMRRDVKLVQDVITRMENGYYLDKDKEKSDAEQGKEKD